MCSEIQDGGEVCRADQGRNCGSFEKATPENTKKQLNMELRFLTVSLRKWRNIWSNYKFKTNIEIIHKINSQLFVSENLNMTADSRKPIVCTRIKDYSIIEKEVD